MPGLLAHSPADITRYLLIDEGLGTLPTDSSSWPVFVGVEADTPDNVITVFDTTSRLDGRTHNEGEVAERQGIQVRVRARDHATAYAKAQAITIALDQDVYTTR